MAEWDGNDRRSYGDLRDVVKEELAPIKEQQAEMRKAQILIERKITEWELASGLFRKFIIGTAGIIAAGAGAYEWLRDHIK